MFGSKHQITVDTHPNGYGYRYSYRCTCGARGWKAASINTAMQQGRAHKQKAEAK